MMLALKQNLGIRPNEKISQTQIIDLLQTNLQKVRSNLINHLQRMIEKHNYTESQTSVHSKNINVIVHNIEAFGDMARGFPFSFKQPVKLKNTRLLKTNEKKNKETKKKNKPKPGAGYVCLPMDKKANGNLRSCLQDAVINASYLFGLDLSRAIYERFPPSETEDTSTIEMFQSQIISEHFDVS